MVVAKHAADYLLYTPLTAVTDHLVGQDAAEAVSLHVGAYDDPEIGADIIRIRRNPDHAQRLGLSVLLSGVGDERHLSVVVDLCEPRHLRVTKLAHLPKKTQAPVFEAKLGEQLGVGRLVLGPDGPKEDGSPVEFNVFLELPWVRSNGEATWALFSGADHADARVYCQNAVLVRE